jgi:hypothetical protein
MATGYTVRMGELASGGGKVTKQGQQCTEVAAAVVGAIAQMAGDCPIRKLRESHCRGGYPPEWGR